MLNSIVFERVGRICLVVQSGERYIFMTRSLLLKLKDVHINRARVKHCAGFAASRDYNMYIYMVTSVVNIEYNSDTCSVDYSPSYFIMCL